MDNENLLTLARSCADAAFSQCASQACGDQSWERLYAEERRNGLSSIREELAKRESHNQMCYAAMKQAASLLRDNSHIISNPNHKTEIDKMVRKLLLLSGWPVESIARFIAEN